MRCRDTNTVEVTARKLQSRDSTQVSWPWTEHFWTHECVSKWMYVDKQVNSSALISPQRLSLYQCADSLTMDASRTEPCRQILAFSASYLFWLFHACRACLSRYTKCFRKASVLLSFTYSFYCATLFQCSLHIRSLRKHSEVKWKQLYMSRCRWSTKFFSLFCFTDCLDKFCRLLSSWPLFMVLP